MASRRDCLLPLSFLSVTLRGFHLKGGFVAMFSWMCALDVGCDWDMVRVRESPSQLYIENIEKGEVMKR